jgi:plastocyanin
VQLTVNAEISISRRPPELLVPVLGLIYSSVLVLILSLFESPPITASNPWPLIGVGFAVILLVAAVLIWRTSRVGYPLGIVTSAIFIAIFGPADIQDSLTGFADLASFLQGLTLIVALVLSLIYAVLGVRLYRRPSRSRQAPRSIPASAALALIGGGFVLGGAVIGVLAAGVESRLLASTAATGDIVIVRGAADPNNAQPYSPSSLNVNVGTTVTWVNKDTVTHTVTSQGSSLFDSANLPTGGTFSYTFTQGGTYGYYCTVHPWMKGTVIAGSG